MDGPNRRHLSGISTRGSSDSRSLHVSTKGILQPSRQNHLEAQQGNLRITQQPKAWQNHLAQVLKQLGLQRSAAEPNIYFTSTRDCFVLVYVDDLLFLGEEQVTNQLFTAIQQQLLLRPTGTLTPGNTVSFLGRNITNRGDHYEISLNDDYTTTLLTEMGLQNCKPAPAPGTSALKTATADHEQALSQEEHAQFRRAVGKLQWMTYTRPDISYATKELARSLQQPTTADQQKLKHLLRYIKGTRHYKQIIRPTAKIPPRAIPDLNVFVDSDWAGCPQTRRSTSGFVITLLGATINYGSRTQATIALSSAEAELYAINTGATEALHLRNLLIELLNVSKVNIKIQQTLRVARAWQHASGHRERPNTLTWNIYSYNNWSSTITCGWSKYTPTTTRQTYSQNMSQQPNRHPATTPSTGWNHFPAALPQLTHHLNSFTSSSV